MMPPRNTHQGQIMHTLHCPAPIHKHLIVGLSVFIAVKQITPKVQGNGKANQFLHLGGHPTQTFGKNTSRNHSILKELGIQTRASILQISRGSSMCRHAQLSNSMSSQGRCRPDPARYVPARHKLHAALSVAPACPCHSENMHGKHRAPGPLRAPTQPTAHIRATFVVGPARRQGGKEWRSMCLRLQPLLHLQVGVETWLT